MGSSEFSSDTIVKNEGIDAVRSKFCFNQKEKENKCHEKEKKLNDRNIILDWKH